MTDNTEENNLLKEEDNISHEGDTHSEIDDSARLAKNIIGTRIVADGEEILKNEATEQAYKELGTSILEYQDVIAGHGKDQDNGKTISNI